MAQVSRHSLVSPCLGRWIFRRAVGLGVLLLLLGPASVTRAADSGPTILILHSYHADLGWTAGIMRAMQERLTARRPGLSLHVEYLDTKRNPGPEYRRDYLDGVLPQKLRNLTFDLVMTSDNDALTFVLRHRSDLFRGKPVVFCGVNGFRPSMLANDRLMTGVAEAPAFSETIQTALRLHPGTREVIFVGETLTDTGRSNHDVLAALQRKMQPAVQGEFWDNLASEQLREKLPRLQPGQLVFLASVIRGGEGQALTFEESARLVRKLSPVPIYGFWDFFIGQGIVGGKLTSSAGQGALAADVALRVLAGEVPASIPVTTDEANRFIFDYRELRRFGIGEEMLPVGSEVLNGPAGFYRLNKWQLWSGVCLILLLCLLVSLLCYTAIRGRRDGAALAERARLAALGAEVGRILTSGVVLRPTLQACAEALVRQTGSSFGRIWTVSADDPELLELQASAGLYTRIDGRHSRKRVGELKIGIIARSRRPLLTNKVVGDPNFSDQDWIREEKIVGFAGYPLVVQNHLVGVAAFFSREELTPVAQQAIASVADMIAVGIERLRAEKERQHALLVAEEGREQIDAILHSVADGLIVTDLENRVVLINPAAEKLLDITFARAALQPMSAAVQGKPFAEPLLELLAACGGEDDFTVEVDGRRIAIHARASAVTRGEGETAGAVALLRDVTRERELDQMKSEFIAIAAHELRTPLATVLGYAELLLSEEPGSLFTPAQRLEYLTYIYDKGELLERIIDDLLDLGRMESGRTIHLERKPCEMVGMVKEIIRHHQQETSRHRFEVDCPATSIRIDIDHGKILRVFDNLLSNAVKYSPAGGAIRISGGVNEDWLQVSVADQGVGMTPDQLAHVFEKFYRADGSDTATRGLGLGLTISKGIIEAHGGQIWLESRTGAGTEVFFRLPVNRSLPA